MERVLLTTGTSFLPGAILIARRHGLRIYVFVCNAVRRHRSRERIIKYYDLLLLTLEYVICSLHRVPCSVRYGPRVTKL